MNREYRTLAGRIRKELPALRGVATRAERSIAEFRVGNDDRYVDAAALNLHALYAGLERLFELIARTIDESMQASATWHTELLSQMASSLTDVRPAVISDDLRNRLDRLRGFRHVVRNAYTFNLDPAQIAILVAALPTTLDMIEDELPRFVDFLESADDG